MTQQNILRPDTIDHNSPFGSAVARVKNGGNAHEEAVRLFGQLSNKERLDLLDGDTPFWTGLFEIVARYNDRPYVHGAVARLGIPGVRFSDGPRGCSLGSSTSFPVSMARGAAWDPELEEKVGHVIGTEIRAQGGNFSGSVCINVLRHPGWGRAQETYGADSYLLGELGSALVTGLKPHVMACAKHFALNSIENVRFKVNVTISEEDLHDVYLPHFKRTVEAGALCIMSAYNKVNGDHAGESKYLLTDVLRDNWGYEGIVMSDFTLGLRNAAKSLEAGMDIEAPFAMVRARDLEAQLARHETSWSSVERAGLRIIETQLKYYAERSEQQYNPAEVASASSRALSREVATRSIVLLKNDNVNGKPLLPLEPNSVKKIAVIGRLADMANLGDEGSSRVWPTTTVSPYQGIKAAYPGSEVVLVDKDNKAAAVRAAKNADVAIIVPGYDAIDEGEFVQPIKSMSQDTLALLPPFPSWGTRVKAVLSFVRQILGKGLRDTGGDRRSLALRKFDEELIREVAAVNRNTVVSIVAGSAVTIDAWQDKVPAILMLWYPGMEGGHALADILTGKKNPSGRLPFAVPKSQEHTAPFDCDATEVVYGRLHDQRLIDSLGVKAAFPFGFGLSYTDFKITDAKLSAVSGDAGTLKVTVTNTGKRSGRHVVQVYGKVSGEKEGFTLVGFKGAEIEAGATSVIDVSVSLLPLARWNRSKQTRILPPVERVVLEVGSYARDDNALILSDINSHLAQPVLEHSA